jgi:hypothetical protein
VSRFRPWPWCRCCRMGPPFGALPTMRMTASWSPTREGRTEYKVAAERQAPPRLASSPLIRSAVCRPPMAPPVSNRRRCPPLRPMVFEEVRSDQCNMTRAPRPERVAVDPSHGLPGRGARSCRIDRTAPLRKRGRRGGGHGEEWPRRSLPASETEKRRKGTNRKN